MVSYTHGLDRSTAPAAAVAKRMLEAIGGSWWNVYIGGPASGGSGWSPAQVREYVQHGIERFMLTYVGRQAGGRLTRAQGLADGRDALAITAHYGYSGNVPICLDLEAGTYHSSPTGTLEYVHAWCAAVKAAGARPGIYSNPDTLKILHGRVPAEFVWVACWISHGRVDADPRQVHGMPSTMWPAQGQRAWQHSGAYGKTRCQVLGLDVDISVADPGCLAGPPGLHLAPASPSTAHALRRGDRGPAVRQLTRRLSYVRSPTTHKPYLDGQRASFDAATDTALMAFQSEHRIKPRGIFGAATQHALNRAVALEKARHAKAPQPNRPGAPAHPSPRGEAGGSGLQRSVGFASLVADVRRLDAEADNAWRRLVSYELRRARELPELEDEAVNLGDIARLLAKIEQTLQTLVGLEQSEISILSEPAAMGASVGQHLAPTVAGSTVAEPLQPGATPHSPPGNAGGQPPPAPPSSAPAATAAPVAMQPDHKLEDLPTGELLKRANRLDHALGSAREVLIARFAVIERKLTKLAHTHPQMPAASTTSGGATPRPAAGPQRPAAGKLPVGKLQHALNEFTRRYLHGLAPIAVDGKKGPETQKRIGEVKFYLGYGNGQKSPVVDSSFIKRLAKPGALAHSTPAMIQRGKARRERQRKLAKQSPAQHSGTVMIDGHRVAGWIATQVLWARAHGWQGRVNSGYRTPEESENYCLTRYGAPKVAGRCAGRTSNHAHLIAPGGAVDVTEPAQFAAAMRRSPHTPTLCNALPATDPEHFSHTGH